MSDEQNQVDIYEVFLLAYRQGMPVKEFRQAVMAVARESKNAPLKAAMMQLIPNMSNAKLAAIMDNTARLKADLIRHKLGLLPTAREDAP